MNKEQVRNYIAWKIGKIGSQVKAAKAWGVTTNFLWYVLKGKRDPGEKILKGVGIRKVVIYECVETTEQQEFLGAITAEGRKREIYGEGSGA